MLKQMKKLVFVGVLLCSVAMAGAAEFVLTGPTVLYDTFADTGNPLDSGKWTTWKDSDVTSETYTQGAGEFLYLEYTNSANYRGIGITSVDTYDIFDGEKEFGLAVMTNNTKVGSNTWSKIAFLTTDGRETATSNGFVIEHQRYNSSGKSQSRLRQFDADTVGNPYGTHTTLHTGTYSGADNEISVSLILDGSDYEFYYEFNSSTGPGTVAKITGTHTLTAAQLVDGIHMSAATSSGDITGSQTGFVAYAGVVPEPATISLLVAGGGLALIRRRRAVK